ncbi:MAG: MYXO-CTERM sorting domain-containing protein [Planctomycetota bacterium]
MVLDTRASVLAIASTAMVVVCTAGARADFMVPPDAPILPGTGATVEEILDPDGPFKGSFTVYDKRFDFTSFVPVGASTQPDLVTVVPWVAPNPLDAVGFDLIGQWVDPAGDALATGFTIVFDVTVLDPDLLINDARLTFNGSASGPGSFAKVSETITDPEGGGGLIDNLEVTADISEDFWQGAPDEGYRTINVVKDFTLFAPPDGGFAGASFIRQTFSQIPSPGTGALAGLALSMGLARRRRGSH